MTVYAVCGYFAWEGSSILAIFDTKEKAEFYEKRQRKCVNIYDGYVIKEYTVR